MRFISQPGNWALLIDLNYSENTGSSNRILQVEDPRFKYLQREHRFIGRQDSTELIIEIDHNDKEEYHADRSVGVLRWEHQRRKKLLQAYLRPCNQNFCPRIPEDKTYDKWYAESGPFEQKVPEPEQRRNIWLPMSKMHISLSLEEIKDNTVDWDFSYLSDWEGTFDYESDQVPDMLFGTINFFDDNIFSCVLDER